MCIEVSSICVPPLADSTVGTGPAPLERECIVNPIAKGLGIYARVAVERGHWQNGARGRQSICCHVQRASLILAHLTVCGGEDGTVR